MADNAPTTSSGPPASSPPAREDGDSCRGDERGHDRPAGIRPRPGRCRGGGRSISPYFLSDSARWLWRYRLNQLAARPECAGWLSKVVIAEPEGTVVGFAGFHGPPDETGMVEIGYSVDPDHRRRGYARAILAALMRRAAADARVRTLRLTISPDNAASLATIAGFELHGGRRTVGRGGRPRNHLRDPRLRDIRLLDTTRGARYRRS